MDQHFSPIRARGRARGFMRPPIAPKTSECQQGKTELSMPFQNMRLTRPTRLLQNPRPPVVQIKPQIMPTHGQRIEKMSTDEVILAGHGEIGHDQIKCGFYRPPRPESSIGVSGKQGKCGQHIKLISNYYPITSYTNWQLYQYRVDFSPEVSSISMQRGLISFHKERLGGYIFDGTMLFSSVKYEPEKFELTSKGSEDSKIVKIFITFTAVLEPNNYIYIQVFNLLLRNCLRHLGLKLVNRNYYDADAKVNIPKHKLQLWPGYETSIGMYDNGLLLRIEICTKVMRDENVLDFFHQCFAGKTSAERHDCMINFKRGVIGTIVQTKYNNQTYRIDDVADDQNIHSTFANKDGTRMSYVEYYKKRWNLMIKHGNQPLLVSKMKKSLKHKGDEVDLIYLIPEFCTLTGISDDMRNNMTLMKDLAVYTRLGPQARTERYNKFMSRLNQPECMDVFKRWNLTVKNNLVEIPARELPAEKLFSRKNEYDSGPRADWTNHLRSSPMFLCAEIKQWVVITPSRHVMEVRQFLTSLKRASDGMSFSLPQPKLIEIPDTQVKSYIQSMEKTINELNPSLIFCVISTPRSDIYSAIKRKLCIDRSVPSQVVLFKNVAKNNLSVCTKIAIQINCKLGGVPWLIKIPCPKMMIVGFDVCHDVKNKNKSFGALVATMNDNHTSYFSCVQQHGSGEEISNFFASSIAKALFKYKDKNKFFPTSIVVYRDGVGDGQISYVNKVEVNTIKDTCKQINPDGEIDLAFIIVKKRISSRFFLQSDSGMQNPRSGTVIDSVVTDPTMYDFFLVSQHVSQGTVTPTHYNVIEDTLKNWSPDRMQRLTYKLTHMYYNWSGTVRVPAPCQLAHKLAFFVAQSLGRAPNNNLDELLYFL